MVEESQLEILKRYFKDRVLPEQVEKKHGECGVD